MPRIVRDGLVVSSVIVLTGLMLFFAQAEWFIQDPVGSGRRAAPVYI